MGGGGLATGVVSICGGQGAGFLARPRSLAESWLERRGMVPEGADMPTAGEAKVRGVCAVGRVGEPRMQVQEN